MADSKLSSRVMPGHVPADVALQRIEYPGAVALLARDGQRATLARRSKRQFGFALTDGPICTQMNELMVWGMGPGRWMVFASQSRPGWEAELAESLAGCASVFDQSSQFAMWRLSGESASALLQKALFVDLDSDRFPVGNCCTGLAAEVTMTAARIADQVWEIAVPRSFADHVSHWMETAAANAGIELHLDKQR